MILPVGMNSTVSAFTSIPGVKGRLDPYGAYNFLVEIDGLVSGGFTSAQGLEGTIATEDKPEGGVNNFTRKVLGATSYPNLVLVKGLIDLDMLWTWFDQTRQGVIQRKNMTLMLLDNARWPATWWDFKGVIPVRWAGPQLDSSQPQVAMETVELAHCGFQKPYASTLTSGVRGAVSIGTQIV